MEKKQIVELQAQRGDPSISITLPVFYASATELQQTGIRLKNLLAQTEQQLREKYEARQITGVLNRLHALADGVDTQRHIGGLAIFANPNFGRVMYLATPLEERVVINHNFATREIVRALLASPRYRVLSLTEHGAQLYEGRRDRLHPVQNVGFPLTSGVEGVQTELPGTYGVEVSALENSQVRDFFQRVETALKEVADHDPLPLALAGVERTLAYFDKVAGGNADEKFNVVARLHGNYEKVGLAEMEAKLWPIVEPALHGNRERAKARLEEAVGPGRAAFGLQKVWEHANTGRIDTLLVEKDYRQSARIVPGEMPAGTLEIGDNSGNGAGQMLPDAVDEIIEIVMKNSGDVVFVESNELVEPGISPRFCAIKSKENNVQTRKNPARTASGKASRRTTGAQR